MARSEKAKETGSSPSPYTRAKPGKRGEVELSEEELDKVSGGFGGGGTTNPKKPGL